MIGIATFDPSGEGDENLRKRFTGESEAVKRGDYSYFPRRSDMWAVKVNAYIYLKIYRLNLHRSPEASGAGWIVLLNFPSRRRKGGSR